MEYKFSDIFTWTSGKPVTTDEGDIPVYGSNGVIGFCSNAKYKNQIILGRVGAYCGSVEYCPGEFNATDNTLITTCDENYIRYGYAYYLLKQYKLNNLAGGAAQPLITQGLLKHLKCDLPSVEYQDKVYSFLKQFEDLIANYKIRIDSLERVIASIYKEWFIRFRFPGHEDVQIVDGIPAGWNYKTMDEITAVLQRGISPQYDDDGDTRVISQKCIRTNIMDISEARSQSKSYKDQLNLQDADVVICSTGTGTLGRVGRVIGEYPRTTFDSHVTLVRAKEGISKQFLYGALKNLQPWLTNMGIGSTNQQELYRSVIGGAKVLVPDNELMDRYEELIIPIHNEIALINSKLDLISKQRDLFIPRLLSGRIVLQ